jgi:6-phosphogluconolactonase (cycloisomerase 2 family)
MNRSAAATAGTVDRSTITEVGVVLVHTNAPAENQILAYIRSLDGALIRSGAYATGGAGAAQQGAPADPLASQDSLVRDPRTGSIYVVNAGTDTLSVFATDSGRLQLAQTLRTDGEFPASIAASGDLVFVLNAGGDGTISGFRVDGGGLRPIPGSTRRLGLGNTNPPYFLSSPAQIGFAPDARHLIVTTKNHNRIVTFRVDDDGRPSDVPVVTDSAGPVPFSFLFDRHHHLIITEASGAVSSYAVEADGRLSVISSSVPNGQQATCWIAAAKGFVYAVNAGSGTISGYTVDAGGRVRLLDRDGVTARPGPGAIDAAATPNGEYLYVQNGATASIHPYRVNDDGSLTALPEVGGLPRFGAHSAEGIIAY